jgi:hypothetical protein
LNPHKKVPIADLLFPDWLKFPLMWVPNLVKNAPFPTPPWPAALARPKKPLAFGRPNGLILSGFLGVV